MGVEAVVVVLLVGTAALVTLGETTTLSVGPVMSVVVESRGSGISGIPRFTYTSD